MPTGGMHYNFQSEVIFLVPSYKSIEDVSGVGISSITAVNVELELEENSEIADDDRTWLNKVALFCLKLQAKFLLPASTMQDIVEEFQTVHNISHKHT